MRENRELPWIMEGYHLFSKEGPNGLNVQSIARKLEKNKSSFYHYFGDMEVFQNQLLEYHIHRTKILTPKIRACEQMNPDVLHVLVEGKEDLFFHRQLRLQREIPAFKKCMEAAYQEFEAAILDSWTNSLQLSHQPIFAKSFLKIITDNFLLRITKEHFHFQWLSQYLQEIQQLVRPMISSHSDP